MSKLFKTYLGPLIAAIIVTIILGCFFQTQRVISMLGDIGGSVSWGERIGMTFYDIRHLGSLYGVFIAIALLIALTLSLFLERFFKNLESVLYIIAGMVAMVILLFAMKQVFFDVHLIAGARDGFGIALQAIAGGFGGKVFHRLRRPKMIDIAS